MSKYANGRVGSFRVSIPNVSHGASSGEHAFAVFVTVSVVVFFVVSLGISLGISLVAPHGDICRAVCRSGLCAEADGDVEGVCGGARGLFELAALRPAATMQGRVRCPRREK